MSEDTISPNFQRKIQPMAWVVLCTCLVYIIANAPLLYSLVCTHGVKGIAALWGYSPHQFVFIIFIFPFAAFCAFVGIYVMYSRVGPLLPDGYSGKWFFDNGIIILLGSLCLASIIAAADSFSSARSLDKLRPLYATRAVACLSLLTDQFDNIPQDQRLAKREMLIREAKKAKDQLILPPHNDHQATKAFVAKLSPQVFLQVVQDPFLQRRLDLVDAVTYNLSIVQVVITLFTVFCTVIGMLAVITLHASHEVEATIKNSQELQTLLTAVFAAIVFFGFYSICFHQYRSEIEQFVGTAGTTLQHVAAGVAVTLSLVLLVVLTPNKKEVSDTLLTRVVPLALIVTGFGVEAKVPGVLRQIIGIETNIGRQVIFLTLFLLGAAVSTFLVWPRK